MVIGIALFSDTHKIPDMLICLKAGIKPFIFSVSNDKVSALIFDAFTLFSYHIIQIWIVVITEKAQIRNQSGNGIDSSIPHIVIKNGRLFYAGLLNNCFHFILKPIFPAMV